MSYCICEECGSVAKEGEGGKIICPNGCKVVKKEEKILPPGFGTEYTSGKKSTSGWGQ